MQTAEIIGPTVEQTLRIATQQLADAGSPTPRLDADLLLAEALGRPRVSLYSHNKRRLAFQEQEKFEAFLQRRVEGENVAYIRGRKEFYSLDFTVSPAVLIPRPETEMLVELGIHFLRYLGKPRPRVLDLCTGSGCVAIAMAVHLPGVRYVASDVSGEALEVARENAEQHGVADSIQFHEADGLAGLAEAGKSEPFDLIVANPPYIASDRIEDLDSGIHAYEPRLALDGGPDGQDFYRVVLPLLPGWLTNISTAAFEIGWDQGPAVQRMMADALPDAEVHLHPDAAGRDRVVQAIRPAGLVADSTSGKA